MEDLHFRGYILQSLVLLSVVQVQCVNYNNGAVPSRQGTPLSPPPVSVSESASILTTETFPTEAKLRPEVGNGHIATVIGDPHVFMNGLYNGHNTSSHRARIRSPVRYEVISTMPAHLNTSFSLDMARAVFTERHSSPRVNISIRTYAHQLLTHLLVLEVEMTRHDINDDVSVTLKLDAGSNPSHDPGTVDTESIGQDQDGLWRMRTLEAEFPELAPRTEFYIKTSPSLNGTMRMTDNATKETFLGLASMGKSLGRVKADFSLGMLWFQSGVLLANHVREWAATWRAGRVEVEGDVHIAQLTHGAMYYMLSSLPLRDDPASPFIGLSPGGLAHGLEGQDYYGHVFWDQSTWMFPGIAVLHADVGKIMAKTRTRTLDASKIQAEREGFKGAKFAWESAYTGLETCPLSLYSDNEIHITADVALMIQQYWRLTGDLNFMKKDGGAELVRQTADFWLSRTQLNHTTNLYNINNVMGPDEFHAPVNNSAYTNVAASLNLMFASKLSSILGLDDNAAWRDVAVRLTVPYDSKKDFHPEFEGYSWPDVTKQADVVLLNFPLMMDMNVSTLRQDLVMYETSTPTTNVPAMTWGAFLIGWLQLGDEDKAAALFNRSSLNAQPPFLVWTETQEGSGATNFITGMGGYLQAQVFGYGGCRIYDDHLTFNPKLPPGVSKMKFIGIDYQGGSFDLIYDEMHMTINMTSAPPNGKLLEVHLHLGRMYDILEPPRPLVATRQRMDVRVITPADPGVVG